MRIFLCRTARYIFLQCKIMLSFHFLQISLSRFNFYCC